MSRRKKRNSNNNRYSQLIGKLDFFENTPFCGITGTFKECLEEGEEAVRLNILDSTAVRDLHNSIHHIVELFPNSFNDRFWFDYWMIDGIAESFNIDGQILAGLLVPRYDEEWAHISRITPVGKGDGGGASINFICFPGEENVGDIDLLEYSFLLHEIGHNLFFYKEEIFIQKFSSEFQKIIGSLKRRSISDIGTAKTKSEKQLQRLKGLWSPRNDQKDWAHETLMDLFALWTCGPAYLASFLYEMEDEDKNPYLIKPIHPPYSFRIEILIIAGKKLGWHNHLNGLEKLLVKWEKSRWSKEINNNYHALTHEKMREAIIKAAFETFKELKLPQCNKASIEQVNKKLNKSENPNWGIETILAAWLFREKYTPANNEKTYEKWEQNLVKTKLDSLTP